MTGNGEPSIYEQLAERVAALRPVVLATIVDGPGLGAKLLADDDGFRSGSLGVADLDRVVLRDALGELASGTTAVRHYGERGEAGDDTVTVFIESFAPPHRMLIFGAIDFTAALCRVAKVLGFHVTVCDAREVFATSLRFPLADEIVIDWPHRLLDRVAPPLGPRDAICVLTHDPKFDVPAIMAAFDSGVGYVGALGSRRTAATRRAELVAAGATETQLARLRAPIGLDLGGRTPEETAVSIAAEIISLRNGHGAGPLATTEGPIHT